MIKKNMFCLLASMLAITYVSAQQNPQVRDTSEVGAMYVVDPMTFQTTTGYVKRVVYSEFTYQRKPDDKPLGDSVTYVKTKVPKAVNYYLVKPIQGKETWIIVRVIQDYDINLKLK